MANEITPATRWERLLSEVLGEEYAVIPVTRIEKFLANILGEEYDLIPVTRIEKLLAKIAEEGGGGGAYTNSDWLDFTKPVGEVNSDVAISNDTVYSGVFKYHTGITKLVLPNATIIPASFANQAANLEEVIADNVTKIYAYAFGSCMRLNRVSFKNLVDLEGNGMRSCQALITLVFPKLSRVDVTSLYDCKNLEAVDFGGDVSTGTNRGIYAAACQGCSKLETVVLRSQSVWPLINYNALNGTPFASNGTGGTLYVPQTLIASYQAETNWATILGYTNNQILPIEGSIYETQYADGTPIT